MRLIPPAQADFGERDQARDRASGRPTTLTSASHGSGLRTRAARSAPAARTPVERPGGGSDRDAPSEPTELFFEIHRPVGHLHKPVRRPVTELAADGRGRRAFHELAAGAMAVVGEEHTAVRL